MARTKKNRILSCDFETNYSIPTWVWAYTIVDIYSEEVVNTGSDIVSFLDDLHDGDLCFFHNAKFDCTFLIDLFYRCGFKYRDFIEESMQADVFDVSRKLHDNEFTIVMNMQRLFYSMRMKRNGKTIEFRDSWKKVPFKVSEIGNSFFGIKDLEKFKIAYRKFRIPFMPLTDEEKEYIERDAIIVARALKELFNAGLDKLTISADALAKYRSIVPAKKFAKLFPVMSKGEYKYIHDSYKGGYTYVRKDFEGIDIYGAMGHTVDKNSLYPYTQVNYPMPIGAPVYFVGKYKEDRNHPLYIQRVHVMFQLKPYHLPTIQIKGNIRFYVPTEYLECSDGMCELTLTRPDMELLLEHYNIIEIDYIDGFKFMQSMTLFNDYIYPIYEQKCITKGAKRSINKLQLVSLYGKFAKSIDVSHIKPTFEESTVKYKSIVKEFCDGLYIPVGTYITAWARWDTITNCQRMYDIFRYTDTDSYHFDGAVPGWLEIHPTKLGACKVENYWTRARFIQAKRYMEINDFTGEVVVKCAGMSDDAKAFATWDNFKNGSTFKGGLKARNVPGGIILVDSDFKMS